MRTTVLGGGAWGTALASHAARAGLPVRIWIREPEVVTKTVPGKFFATRAAASWNSKPWPKQRE